MNYYFEVSENVLVYEGKCQFGRLVEFERREGSALIFKNEIRFDLDSKSLIKILFDYIS